MNICIYLCCCDGMHVCMDGWMDVVMVCMHACVCMYDLCIHACVCVSTCVWSMNLASARLVEHLQEITNHSTCICSRGGSSKVYFQRLRSDHPWVGSSACTMANTCVCTAMHPPKTLQVCTMGAAAKMSTAQRSRNRNPALWVQHLALEGHDLLGDHKTSVPSDGDVD